MNSMDDDSNEFLHTSKKNLNISKLIPIQTPKYAKK